MKIKISVPNDYGSREIEDMAIEELYDGDRKAAELDHGQALFNRLGDIAREAGLVDIENTDSGCIWEGSADAVKKAKNDLPEWASISDMEGE